MTRFYIPATFLALAALCRGSGPAAPRAESFATPEAAANALVHAVESNDLTQAMRILGPDAKELLTTSDAVEDQQAREAFVEKAKEGLSVVPDPARPSQRIIELGDDRWPFPVPIVQSAGRWHFDIEQGKAAILIRRIGHNELNAIDLSRGYVEAQSEYFEQDRMGAGLRQYAQRFISSPDKRDGLYWKSDDETDESPIEELVAQAIAEGYTERNEPFHGYYFRILTSQGPNAPGGEMNYVEDGAMTKGFALVAWPADYRSTGVMTFLVDSSGIVYEKDLGDDTANIAKNITAYDPDSTWSPVVSDSVVPNAEPAETVESTSRQEPTH